MDLKEKLELAIRAARQRRDELDKICLPSTCLFCKAVNHSCSECLVHGYDNPLSHLLHYPCNQYCLDLDNVIHNIDKQIDIWERELEEIEETG